MKLKILAFATAIVMGASISINAQEVINNQSIIEMLQMGLDEETIIGMIDLADVRDFTITPSSIKELVEAGAGTNLIKIIQKSKKVDNAKQGLYLVKSDGTHTHLYRSTFEIQEGGFKASKLVTGAAIMGGVASGLNGNIMGIAGAVAGANLLGDAGKNFKKLKLQGAHAKVVLSGEEASNPTFRFYFPRSEQGESFQTPNDAAFFNWMCSIESPNEFQCVKMKSNEKKKNRMFPDKSSYTIAGFSVSGGSNRDVIDFEINEINNNTFEVTFPNGLEPGEYIFLYKNGLESDFFKAQPFGFDFSVQ